MSTPATAQILAGQPYALLRELRAREPVSFVPDLGGWLVTSAALAEQVMRDAASFTVDDPRFTTARVVGPSMLSLDGPRHRHHRDPFARALRGPDLLSRLRAVAASTAAGLVASLAAAPGRRAELRRGLAGPLAVAVMAELLGLRVTGAQLLTWYDAIVAGVTSLPRAAPGAEVPASAAAAVRELAASVAAAVAAGGESTLAAAARQLEPGEVVSNAAVLLFGGIETTEGMICNAIWHLLREPAAARAVDADRALIGPAVEESLRLEPAAAMVDRYATADVTLGGAPVRRRDLVVVSLTAAGRDPAVFADPDRFDLHRANAGRHAAFAVGPHYCIGAQLARLETAAAVGALLDGLPLAGGLRLDPDVPSAPSGLVFRKPQTLQVRWD